MEMGVQLEVSTNFCLSPLKTSWLRVLEMLKDEGKVHLKEMGETLQRRLQQLLQMVPVEKAMHLPLQRLQLKNPLRLLHPQPRPPPSEC